MSTGFDIALLTFGVILFLLGLIGRVKAKEMDVGTNNVLARSIGGTLGVLFIGLSLAPHDAVRSFFTKGNPAAKEAWEGTWRYVTIDRAGTIVTGRPQIALCPNDLISGVFEDEPAGSGTVLGQLGPDSRTVAGQWTNAQKRQTGRFAFHLRSQEAGFCGTYSLGITDPEANPLNFWNGRKESQNKDNLPCPSKPPGQSG